MARQPRSRPEPVPKPVTPDPEVSGAGEYRHDRPDLPATPDAVFADYAADLAARYDVPATDAEAALRRLAATFVEEVADTSHLADALRRPALTLLAAALAEMPGPEAVRLILTADLADLARRVRVTAWLASPETPLYSHAELGHALAALAADLHIDREHLVRTGLPSRPYPGSPWLYHQLGRLYPTRQAASFVPHAERFSNPRPGAPPYTWLQTPHRDVNAGADFRECEYDQADFLPGLSAEDGLRVEADRGWLLDVKVRLLGRMAQALSDRRANGLWADVLAALTGEFSRSDIELYVRLGCYYAGRDGPIPLTTNPAAEPDPRAPGGVTDWLAVVGHVEAELTVGTLAAARAALSTRVRALLLDLTGGGPDRDGVPPGQLYFAVYAGSEQPALDAAIDSVTGRQAADDTFWAEYSQRLAAAVAQDFKVSFPVLLAPASAATVGPILRAQAALAEQALAEGRWVSGPPAGPFLFRRTKSYWTIVYEGEFVPRTDLAGLFYLHVLLQHPGQDFDAQTLFQARARWGSDRTARQREKAKEQLKDKGPGSVREVEREILREVVGESGGQGKPDADPVADRTAVRAYEARVRQLDGEIEAADKSGDETALERLRQEQQDVEKQIKAAKSLGGKLRPMSDPAKKARDAVAKAINDVVKGFEDDHPALHRHLTTALRIGAQCCYNPPAPVAWQF